jgi:hypothetical protein
MFASAKVIRRRTHVDVSKYVVVVGIGIAAGLQHQPIFCNPSAELCRPEPAFLPDEAPEGLPRGPAPPPPGNLLQLTPASTASYIPIAGPYPFKV